MSLILIQLCILSFFGAELAFALSDTVPAEASGRSLSIDCGSGEITITSASYGKNCNAGLFNNQLSNLQAACDGKQTCNYQVNHGVIGDPAYGCGKTYEYEYECTGIISDTVPAEASGKSLTIDCGQNSIEIIEASYGENCNAALFNNQLSTLQAACGGQSTCNYRVDHTVIGDPAYGCGKTYEYKYECLSVVSDTVPAEASGKSLSIDCGQNSIEIIEASYGKNCNAGLFNNQLSNLQAACGGKQTCNYQVNHNVIGDPARGCGKTYEYTYECLSVVSDTVPAEASGKSLSIDCGQNSIEIIEASYGENCNAALFNNQLSTLQSACGGQSTCNYRVDHTVIGDPAGGCGKTYEYKYICIAAVDPCAGDPCNDGNECTEDICDAGICSNPPTSIAANCNDGLYCNGEEYCDTNDGTCKAGVVIECQTHTYCDETEQKCLRDCDSFAIDEYLDQCSIYPFSDNELAMATLQSEVGALTVRVNQHDTDISNIGNRITNEVNDINQDIVAVDQKITDEIAAVRGGVADEISTVNAALAALDQKFKGYKPVSASDANSVINPINAGVSSVKSTPYLIQLYGAYKDEIVIMLVLINMIIMVVTCCMYFKSNDKKRYQTVRMVDIDTSDEERALKQ